LPGRSDPSIALALFLMICTAPVMKVFRQRIHPANLFGLTSTWADRGDELTLF